MCMWVSECFGYISIDALMAAASAKQQPQLKVVSAYFVVVFFRCFHKIFHLAASLLFLLVFLTLFGSYRIFGGSTTIVCSFWLVVFRGFWVRFLPFVVQVNEIVAAARLYCYSQSL